MSDGAADTVIVLAKEPLPGRVKTRLQSEFTPGEAAELAAAALQDTLTAVDDARPQHRVAAWDGAGRPWRQHLRSRGFAVVDQPDGDLNARLTAAFLDAADLDAAELGAFDLDSGGSGTSHDQPRRRLLIGMDTPQVTAALLRTDWEGADAVLGLTDDGGFWAIGLNGVNPDRCFRGIPMSTPRTGAAQLNRLVDLGVNIKLLPPLRDVDEPADADAVAYRHPQLIFSQLHQQLLDRRPRQPVDRLFDRAYAGAPLQLDRDAEPVLAIDVARWCGSVDDVDRLIITRCEPPVLDLGAGPGRLVQALTESGRSALGVDISAEAVGISMSRGAPALRAQIEQPLPAEGRWGTVLLIDGNIGIGGDVTRLLTRCRDLVSPGGLIICEVDASTHRHDQAELTLRSRRAASIPLAWSRIGASVLSELAARLDLWVAEEWSAGGRAFLALRSSS